LVAQPIIDYTEENRLTGLIMLAAGLFFAGLPWGLAFGLGILIGKLNGICIALGFPFAIVGYATVVSPPITILKAEENKNRNGAFMLLGFVLAGIEAYFFNKAVGFW
jgi:hypothetical protein